MNKDQIMLLGLEIDLTWPMVNLILICRDGHVLALCMN